MLKGRVMVGHLPWVTRVPPFILSLTLPPPQMWMPLFLLKLILPFFKMEEKQVLSPCCNLQSLPGFSSPQSPIFLNPVFPSALRFDTLPERRPLHRAHYEMDLETPWIKSCPTNHCNRTVKQKVCNLSHLCTLLFPNTAIRKAFSCVLYTQSNKKKRSLWRYLGFLFPFASFVLNDKRDVSQMHLVNELS